MRESQLLLSFIFWPLNRDVYGGYVKTKNSIYIKGQGGDKQKSKSKNETQNFQGSSEGEGF